MTSSTETAYTIIRAAILGGDYGPGERLREEELAARAGVSRTPVREALRLLDGDGLVTFTPMRGAKVTAQSAQELNDLYQLRALLEGYAARIAATRINDDELRHVADLARQMSELADRGPESANLMTDLNGQFHRAVAGAARSHQLVNFVSNLMNVPLIFHTFQRFSRERMLASASQHEDLVHALRAGDAELAEAVMRAHILAARSTLHDGLRNAGADDAANQD